MKITPLTLTDMSIESESLVMLARDARHIVMPLAGYNARKPMVFDDNDVKANLEKVWVGYQNIDERRTLDGGRSLMTGDIAKVENNNENSWWVCCSMGWAQTFEPGTEIQRIG